MAKAKKKKKTKPLKSKKAKKKTATKKKATKSTKKTLKKKSSPKKKVAKKKVTSKTTAKKAKKTTAKTASTASSLVSQRPEDHVLAGESAPSILLQNHRGEEINLQVLTHNHPKMVLYFYPKDDTPGCTTEACAFRDNFSRIQSLGVAVYGISPDDMNSHQKFIEKYHLNFDLLTDKDHKLAEQLGVWKEKSFMGRTYWGVERTTLVFHNGKIVFGWQPVKVDGHVDAVISKLSELS
jgi:peroxiredoxin Q/BCP